MKRLSIGLLTFLAVSGYGFGAEDTVAPTVPAAVPVGNVVFWHDGGLDLDGDGLISDAELTAALAKRCAALRQALAAEAPSFVRHYDLNKDGKLDEQETHAACAKLEERFRAMSKELNQAAIRRFDKDGDGVLNAAEKAELGKSVASISRRAPLPRPDPARQNGRSPAMPAVMVSAATPRPVVEEIALRGEELRREREATHRELLQKFDKDGDGRLNAEEKAKARAALLNKISD